VTLEVKGQVCAFWCICGVGEKGKCTVSPVKGGAAERAGVRKGDRLIWMDGAMTCELTHSAISRMVSVDKCYSPLRVVLHGKVGVVSTRGAGGCSSVM